MILDLGDEVGRTLGDKVGRTSGDEVGRKSGDEVGRKSGDDERFLLCPQNPHKIPKTLKPQV